MNTHKSIFDKCYAFTEAEDARATGLYPFFKPISRSAGSKVYVHGRELLMLGSNNYLGLANDPRLVEAARIATEKFGTSCSGSRFMNGTLDLHEELEARLASFVGKEDALCFSTGYQSNLGSISALLNRGDHVIVDKYDHASIMDGVFLAEGLKHNINLHRYNHNNLKELEKELARIPLEEPKLIVVDGVFSMEGDIVPLPEVKALADKYHAGIYLDEAHAIGVVGRNGRGTCEHFGGDFSLADIIMCTFSKSFGSLGGFVAGDRKVIDYIRHAARPLMFSASMPPANIAAASRALDIMQNEPELIHKLQRNARLLIDGFTAAGFNTGTTETPIVPLVIGDNEKTFLLWKALYEGGIYVNPVISPAVPPQRSLLRISCMAVHEESELSQAIDLISDEARKLGII
ncbi:aminotransferase class I/II-fold pyridoxal phosphate-dependent enzyme [Parasphaerochaeta coccoides]|uniref:Serine palmitoyltransferase n=1 Tax=Parasphaerochaeta coccoides (strain ATCC BAA-1237 / DSM 17374 / SPN1) TaxID=760011 RepID=F4GIG1_PARC1|nr:pyridoxal phosphate-dependent aminotransferase family protein [Parasphaerochaeta coccoides]AEC01669.1 serine palmitoyltransferase [Parasphaerochaeta coccoides DSM 17374]